MNRNVVRADALLLLTAVLWGAAFVAQRVGMNAVGPLTFNGVRFLLGAFSLTPLVVWQQKRKAGKVFEHEPGFAYLRAGLIAGVFLFTAATLQQVGLKYTTAGKAGFITGLYVVIVPLLGLLWRELPDLGTWIGAVMAAAGLYFLSVNESMIIERGDWLELIGAFFWACHVLIVGRYARKLEPVTFSVVQFVWCGTFSLLTAFVQETITLEGLRQAVIPIAYGGLISVGIGYTLQAVAQKDAPSAHAAILLSLEAVFAALTGWALLQETLSWRALGGCGLMLAGTILAQVWPLWFPKDERVV